MSDGTVESIARHLRDELDLLVTKWKGGSAHVSAGKIADMAKEIAEIKSPTPKRPHGPYPDSPTSTWYDQ